MSGSNLEITTTINKDSQTITARVLPGSFLPSAIFIYEYLGEGVLGPYFGVTDRDELIRLPVWSESMTLPLFGNKYVRHSQAKITVDMQTDVDRVISIIVNTTKDLNVALKTDPVVTKIVNIP